jgi:hypothetical protein
MDINAPAQPNEPTSTGHFVNDHHDKLLLASLVVFSYICILILVWWKADSQIITFATTTVSGLVGALVALLTGRKN